MTPTKAPPNLVAAGVFPNLGSYVPPSDFTRPINPIVECPQPQKYISRRKQRRWENANMIILHRILNSSKFQTGRDTHSSDNAIRNQFSLLKIDHDLLLTSSSNQSKRILRQDEFMKEEALWIANVKKQLRPVVEDLLKKRLDLVEFLKNIEYIITLFIDTHTDFSLEGEALDESFLNLLQPTCNEDVENNDDGVSNIESQVYYDREDSKLCIRLQDLPLHRLIVFATCQFFGLHVEVRCPQPPVMQLQYMLSFLCTYQTLCCLLEMLKLPSRAVGIGGRCNICSTGGVPRWEVPWWQETAQRDRPR